MFCGGKTCAAGEFCCEADSGSPPACMKKDREAACRQTNATVSYCDESSDCTGGQMCCAGLTENGVLQICATKARCAESWDRPGASMTPANEVCARGGSCATPGYVCVGQACMPSASRVACGTSTDCPEDKPWCFWDAAAKRGECIERGEWAGEAGVFECDGASDCPGGACCGSGMNMSEQSFCGTVHCTPELAYASRLCRTDADCVLNDGRKVPCSPAPDTLPGIGICNW